MTTRLRSGRARHPSIRWPESHLPTSEQMRAITEEHRSDVLRAVRGVFIGSQTVTEEILEDAVHSAAARLLVRARPARSLRSLWIASACNAVRDVLKSHAVSRRVAWPDGETVQEAALDAELARATTRRAETPAGRVVRGEFRALVARFLREYPATVTHVLWLHEIEGRPHTEIAALLGISRTACKMRGHRGQEQFRTFLRTHDPDVCTGELFADS